MNNISVVIIAKNEEKKIKDCLESVAFSDEVILVDDGSTDKTLEIVKKYTENIYHHKSKGFVEAVRNFAISKATKEWILLLDADEVIPKKLADKLIEIAKENKVDFVKIPRKNYIFNEFIKHNKGWWPDYQIRFFRNGKVTWPETIHTQPVVSGNGLTLNEDEELAIIHTNYETISQFLEKLDRYTTQEATEKGVNTNWEESLLNPSDEFMSRFFAREGYKDGMHGLMLSLLESFYSSVLFAKRWERGGFYKVDQKSFLNKNYKIMKKIASQFEYWYKTEEIKNTKNPLKKIKLKMQRKNLSKKLSK